VLATETFWKSFPGGLSTWPSFGPHFIVGAGDPILKVSQSQLAHGSADIRLVRVRTANPKSPTNSRKPDEAVIDTLTGVYDHAGFVALAKKKFLSSQRRDAPLTLAYFDFEIDDGGESAAGIDMITSALVSMAHKLRDFYRDTDILGRVGDYRLGALLTEYADNAVPVVEGAHAITDATESANRLILTIGMAHAGAGGTLEQLMHDADLRTKEIRRRDASTTHHDNDGSAPVPAKHSKQRTKSGRS
jgi:GGDEF domain-containing protein